MQYIIDGYNFLFRLLSPAGEIQKERDALIQKVSDFVELSGLEATLVFDSHYQEGDASFKKSGLFTIVYTNYGESADDWIIQEVETLGIRPVTVVTSDKTLARHVRSFHKKTINSDEFFALLKAKRRKKIHASKKKKLELPVSNEEVIVLPPKSLHDSFDWYLKEFEKNAPKPVVLRPLKDETKTKPKKTKSEPRNLESEYDRWIRLFGA